MKNAEFFYRQYDKVNWKNQEKTKINYKVNNFIIKKFLTKNNEKSLAIFDIGFGIGFFLKMVQETLSKKFENLNLSGCEPSIKNFKDFQSNSIRSKNAKTSFFNRPFLEVNVNLKFDYITAIYVFPHFESSELPIVLEKVKKMLKKNGLFIFVVANESYIRKKLKQKKDLFIEKNTIIIQGKSYDEILHYSEIPKIGTIIDYNREEKFYLDLFKEKGFKLHSRNDLNDHGFICTIFSFNC